MRSFRALTRAVGLLLVWHVLSGHALAQDAATPPATLTVWNHPIAAMRASYDGLSPQARAQSAQERIERLPPSAAGLPISSELVTAGARSGVLVRVGTNVAFALLPGDVDPGIDLQQAANDAGRRLQAALQARADQQRWDVILRGILVTLASGALAFALVIALRRMRRAAGQPVEAFVSRVQQRVSWLHPEIGARMVSLVYAALDLAAWTLRLLIALAWIGFALLQFPLSAPLGARLAERIATLLSTLGHDIVHALPGLFFACVIFAGARLLVQLIGVAFGLISTGVVRVHWLHADTAKATQQLVVVFVWSAALLAAYPYIPGSETDAFKGLTLLFGVVASLGSAGLAGQAMSGLSAVYSRILRQGEWVRVGDIEGQVLSIGLLATKLRAPAGEEVTIPNAVLMGASTINYSRLAQGGTVVSTSVGIGYDAPWRQVAGLLQLAAARTPALLTDPPPRVVQRQLRTFDIEYVLVGFVRPGQLRSAVLSELNANVLDAFNEFGVQIMTPAFESQPETDVVVPSGRWYDAPAIQPPARPRERRATERPAAG
jgi:small-conductance mechanosensitive channel